MRRILTLVPFASVLSLIILIAPSLHAQINSQIETNIQHPFIVGPATLPPGQYEFRMMQQTDLSAMTATNKQNGASVKFLVRPSQDSHVPRHSELVFDRLGDKDFLTNVYQRGVEVGVAVVEPSREESRLLKQGQAPLQHTEEQQD